jgi:hypothetical protein
MQLVPLAAVPSQNLSIVLAGQAVTINLYLLGAQEAAALYMDLAANGVPIFYARQARAYGALPNTSPRWMLAGRHYEGFEGDFLFIDTQASNVVPTLDPLPAGLGSRWQLMYFSVADLEAAGLAA